MRVYSGLNVDTGGPKLLHSPDMHEAVKPSLNRTEPSLNRNRKKMTALPLCTLIVSLVALSCACGGLRSSPAVSPAVSPARSPISSFADTAAAAALETAKSDPSSVGLQTRIEEYWQARIQGDAQRSLAYEHPDKRKELGENLYRARRASRIDIRTFAIADPDSLQLVADAQEARVPVRIQYQYVFPVPGVKPMLVPTTIQDRWVKQDGVWYHRLDTNVIPVPEKNARQE